MESILGQAIAIIMVALRLLNRNELFSLGEQKEWVQFSIGEQNLDEVDSESDSDKMIVILL